MKTLKEILKLTNDELDVAIGSINDKIFVTDPNGHSAYKFWCDTGKDGFAYHSHDNAGRRRFHLNQIVFGFAKTEKKDTWVLVTIGKIIFEPDVDNKMGDGTYKHINDKRWNNLIGSKWHFKRWFQSRTISIKLIQNKMFLIEN